MIAPILGFAYTHDASAAFVTIFNAVDSGQYNNIGGHNPSNENYLAGYRADNNTTHNNFFVFDLSAITSEVIAAEIRLDTGSIRYLFPGPSHTYDLFDVSTPLSQLVSGDFSVGVNTYNDLGSGNQYGSAVFTQAEDGFGGGTKTITLNNTFLQSINASSGLFAMGGSVTTLSPQSGISHLLFGGTGSADIRELVLTTIEPITTVPLPAAAWLFGSAMLGLFGVARRKKAKR